MVRASARPLRVFSPGESAPRTVVSGAILAGPRTRPYEKCLADSDGAVGAVLKPGALRALFRVDASRLRDRHASLSDVDHRIDEPTRRGIFAGEVDPRERLDRFEEWLLGAVRRASGSRLETIAALGALEKGDVDVGDAARIAECSPRVFIERTRAVVGMTPVEYRRVVRFRAAVRGLSSSPLRALVDVALEAGYADQSHFTREFSSFAAMTPGAYRAKRVRHAFHVSSEDSARR